jgi:hypothetical protein
MPGHDVDARIFAPALVCAKVGQREVVAAMPQCMPIADLIQ